MVSQNLLLLKGVQGIRQQQPLVSFPFHKGLVKKCQSSFSNLNPCGQMWSLRMRVRNLHSFGISLLPCPDLLIQSQWTCRHEEAALPLKPLAVVHTLPSGHDHSLQLAWGAIEAMQLKFTVEF